MRALVCSMLLVFGTASYAYEYHYDPDFNEGYTHGDPHYVATSYAPPVDANGWKHRFDGYYGDGFGNYWDLNCHQRHKNGYFFTKHHRHYYPDYQYPKFGHYGHHYHPFYMRTSHNRKGNPPRGFYRCLSREGLSVECYKQRRGRG